MSAPLDPVDGVIVAFLDHLEGIGPRPSLDELSDADREQARTYLSGLAVARTMDPHMSRPSVEALLADTPLAGLVTGRNPPLPRAARSSSDAVSAADVAAVAEALRRVDDRIWVDIDQGRDVVLSYLDLRVRFVLVPGEQPHVSGAVRTRVQLAFQDDPDTSRVGVVAAGSPDLATQVIAPDDLGTTVTAPHGQPHRRWEPPLPLALAGRRLLEQNAPEWPSFDIDQVRPEPLDLPVLATEIARRLIERESGRSYRGDKRRAYAALVGHETTFADLVSRVSAPSGEVDLAAEIARIAGAAVA